MMLKPNYKSIAKWLILAGATILAISVLISMVALFSTYGIAEDIKPNSTTQLSKLETITKINVYAVYIGCLVATAGIALMVTVHIRKKD